MSKESPQPPPSAEVVDLEQARRIREFAETAERALFSVDGPMADVLEKIREEELVGDAADVAISRALLRAYHTLAEVYRRHLGVDKKTWDRALRRPFEY